MADRTINYEIKLDSSQLEKSLKDVEKKAQTTFKKIADAAADAGLAVEKSMDAIGKAAMEAGEETIASAEKFDEAIDKLSSAVDTAEELTQRASDLELNIDSAGMVQGLDTAAKESDSKFGRIMNAAAKVGKAVGKSLAVVGQAAYKVGSAAVTSATDFDQAMNKFAVSTGVAESSLGGYEQTLKDIYANNYGESFEDIGSAMATVTQQMGQLDSGALQGVTEDAFTLRDTFGMDIAESVKAADTLMTEFGISSDQAMSLIATGAQNGLNSSGELLANITAYSEQFSQAGMSADDMFHLMQQGAESGSLDIEKVGAAVSAMSERVLSGSGAAKEGFAALGLNADEMAAKFAAGGESAQQAFDQTVQALAGMSDPIAQNAAGAALFGSAWEEMGPGVVDQLAAIEEEAYASSDALNQMQELEFDDFGSLMEEMQRSLDLLLVPLGETLIPILSQLIEEVMPPLMEAVEAVMPSVQQFAEDLLPPIMGLLQTILPILVQMIEETLPVFIELLSLLLPPIIELAQTLLPPLLELFKALIEPLMEILGAILPPLIEVLNVLLEPIMDLVDQLLPPLMELFDGIRPLIEALMPIVKSVADVFSSILGGAIEAVMPLLENLMDIFGAIIDFLTNVFTGNWEAAWQGIVDIFKGIINLVPTIIEAVINGAINLINGIIGGINRITGIIGIPAIPLIPKVQLPRFHAGGIVNFRTGEGLAILKDGEMVLTQRQQAELFALANGAASRAAAAATAPVYASISLTGDVQVDGFKLGRVVLKNLDDAAAFTLRG